MQIRISDYNTTVKIEDDLLNLYLACLQIFNPGKTMDNVHYNVRLMYTELVNKPDRPKNMSKAIANRICNKIEAMITY